MRTCDAALGAGPLTPAVAAFRVTRSWEDRRRRTRDPRCGGNSGILIKMDIYLFIFFFLEAGARRTGVSFSEVILRRPLSRSGPVRAGRIRRRRCAVHQEGPLLQQPCDMRDGRRERQKRGRDKRPGPRRPELCFNRSGSTFSTFHNTERLQRWRADPVQCAVSAGMACPGFAGSTRPPPAPPSSECS